MAASSASSSSSHSSSSYPTKHDVFLSFRGKDTRAKFTSHLHKKLCDKGIETYIDNRLERGDDISAAILEAIRSSKISVVVLSENYATSPWCLDEVLCILECKERRGQVVVPVFFEIDPSVVRRQSGSYEVAFTRLQQRYEGNRVDQWRIALTQLANLSGWHSEQYRTESDFVDAMVKDIMRKLNEMSSSDNFKGLVGIRESVEEVEKLLCIDSTDVWMIGVWGMGGVGKTTLARVVFKQISSLFDGHCFLQNVREESERPDGLDKLKKKLFSVLLGENDLDYISAFHEDRLRRKKVLIVLDDVDQPEPLDELAGDQDWFGLGSKVIITTRNDQVLRNRADEKFELKCLNSVSALELFQLNAFKRNYTQTMDDIKMSQLVVNYADGIPLALKVLGSFLRSRRRENWESELERLKKVPNRTIQNVLKISYDGMDDQEQKVFLDIVCFVEIGEKTCRQYIERKLGGVSLKIDIDSLIDKSLIIVEDNYLRMHDLVREMGWEIVRQQCVEEPGQRSRLLHSEDCYHVFKNNTGTITIQGIIARHFHEVVESSPQVFNKMHRLWFLQIDYFPVKFPQEVQNLPSTLKYLEWPHWKFKSLPETFIAHNLVELRMPHSKLERLWSGEQDLGKLKYVDLCYSDNLIDVSALSRAQNLESVDISYCQSLCDVPSLRFGDIGKIYHGCDYKKCSTLGHLNIGGCRKLKVLVGIFGNVKELDLSNCSIEELPTLITSLPNLDCLTLQQCDSFKNLPNNIQNLHSLKRLDLSYCSSFEMLPVLPRNLTHINLTCSGIEQIPSATLECLSMLEELDLSSCKRLQNLPTSICKLKSLKRLSLEGCSRFWIFPEILEPMQCLEVLSLGHTMIQKLSSYMENLTGPREIRCLSSLEVILRSQTSVRETHRGMGIQQLCKLKSLTLRYCSILKSLSELPLSLEVVDARGCCSLNTISNSKDVLQQEQWTDYDVTVRRRFIYYDCPLDQNTRTKMTEEFQLRVLHTAATIILNNIMVVGDPDIGISFPDNEIPKWFTYPSDGSTINVNLPSHWHNNNFLGFALCMVVDPDRFQSDLHLYCELHFRTKRGDTVCNYRWYFGESYNGFRLSCFDGSHMFMWYKHENYHECRDSVQLSIHVDPRFSASRRGTWSDASKVRACGMRILYLQDYEEEFKTSDSNVAEDH